MTQAPPLIFDKALLRARQRRALRRGPASFLRVRAVEEACERLTSVKRDFHAILDLCTPDGAAAAALSERFATARVVWSDPQARTAGRSALVVVGDEETLPFGAGSFDLVVSLLALQTTNDLPGALAQIRRALVPDGLFLACLIGGQSLTELRLSLALAEEELTGGASPRVAPFVDLRDLGALLQRAGFALPVTDVETLKVRYSDLFALIADLRAMGATNILVERSRKPLSRRFWLRAAEIYAQRFSDPDGRVRASFDLVWLSGWAAHESQGKPLAPGSARMRLADALGTVEKKLEP